MTTYHPIKRFSLAALAALALSLLSLDAAPNFLVILVDDMGYADPHHDGSKIDTPNLDQLAKDGIQLTQYYASAPICSPTRAALLTGRYPHSVNVPELASATQRGDVPVLYLDPDAITIPESLKPHGYTSVMVGKWHLGHHAPHWPRANGFDEFWGSLLGTPQFWQPQETYHNETPIEVTGHYTDRLTEKAIEYLHEYHTKPFFLYLAYNAPHYPLEAPFELVSKYRRVYKDDGLFAIYAAMVEQLDAGIGRVLGALDELGHRDDTLVILCSDNGPSPEINSYGPEGADISNGDLREWKFSTHEGGIRVPFLARWPGHIAPGTRRDEPAITMDILPTLLDAAGITPAPDHEIHGQSLVPLLTGQPFARKGALHWENQHNAAVRLGDWKLVHQFWTKPELYNIAKDPTESNDLAAQYPDKVKELLALHEAWKERYYPNPVPRRTRKSSYSFPDLKPKS